MLALSWFFSVRSPKTGGRFRRDEHVVIRSQTLFLTLPAFRKVRSDVSQRIWLGSNESFRSAFHEILVQFRIDHMGYRPYSLRRGVATALFRSGTPMESSLIRGRWASTQSARSYISDGLSQVASISFSSHTRRLLALYSAKLPSPKASV